MAQLASMKAYCEELHRCRHDLLLDYFGDETRKQCLAAPGSGSSSRAPELACGGRCDNCCEREHPGSGGREEARAVARVATGHEGGARLDELGHGQKRKRYRQSHASGTSRQAAMQRIATAGADSNGLDGEQNGLPVGHALAPRSEQHGPAVRAALSGFRRASELLQASTTDEKQARSGVSRKSCTQGAKPAKGSAGANAQQRTLDAIFRPAAMHCGASTVMKTAVMSNIAVGAAAVTSSRAARLAHQGAINAARQRIVALHALRHADAGDQGVVTDSQE
jgi:hypothetical protein